MKKLMALVIVASMVGITGCITTKPTKRELLGNTFHSESPKFSVTIPSSMEYVGHVDRSKAGTTTSGQAVWNTTDWYCFVKADQNKAVDECVIIRIYTTSGSGGFVADLVPKGSYIKDKGRTSEAGREIQWWTRYVNPARNYKPVKFMIEKGYWFSRGVTAHKIFASRSNKALVDILYYKGESSSDALSKIFYQLNENCRLSFN